VLLSLSDDILLGKEVRLQCQQIFQLDTGRGCVKEFGTRTLSGLLHTTEGKYNLRHPVANPY